MHPFEKHRLHGDRKNTHFWQGSDFEKNNFWRHSDSVSMETGNAQLFENASSPWLWLCLHGNRENARFIKCSDFVSIEMGDKTTFGNIQTLSPWKQGKRNFSKILCLNGNKENAYFDNALSPWKRWKTSYSRALTPSKNCETATFWNFPSSVHVNIRVLTLLTYCSLHSCVWFL